ncbi:hypothetical protein ES702_02344 [subsurface metagenome]
MAELEVTAGLVGTGLVEAFFRGFRFTEILGFFEMGGEDGDSRSD